MQQYMTNASAYTARKWFPWFRPLRLYLNVVAAVIPQLCGNDLCCAGTTSAVRERTVNQHKESLRHKNTIGVVPDKLHTY